MDGKDWRLLLANTSPVTCVNCHSLLHDNVWTLSTTITDSNQIDVGELDFISHKDHWIRSMLWSIGAIEVLQTSHYRYEKPLENMRRRLELIKDLHHLQSELRDKINGQYKELFNGESSMPEYITMGINKWNLKMGKIGSFSPPHYTGLDWGIITIHPKALSDMEYVMFVIMHELIHSAFGENCEKKTHHRKFQLMAEKLGLPEAYRD